MGLMRARLNAEERQGSREGNEGGKTCVDGERFRGKNKGGDDTAQLAFAMLVWVRAGKRCLSICLLGGRSNSMVSIYQTAQ